MRRIAARVLVVIGLTIVALGKRIEGQPARPTQRPPTAAKVIILQAGRGYRPVDRRRAAPGKWATLAAGLSILFVSARFGLVGV